MNSNRFVNCVLALVALAFAAPAYSQVDLGQLTGTVKDQAGSVVSGATVGAVNNGTGVARSTRTNASGIYAFPALPQGRYDMTVSAPSFETLHREVAVATGTTTSLDFALQPGSQQQTITVAASPDVELEADSHEVRTSLTTEALTQLPASGRNPLALALTAPGIAPGGDPSVHTSSAQFFVNTSSDVELGGGLDVQTGYIEDGVENVTLLTQTANILPSVESIREMDVITNGADARYRQPGIINITTRSGTTEFHGTAYDFLQNNALNALPYNFSATPPTATPLRYNLFGANLGGPAWRSKKVFFFFDYSGLRSVSTKSSLFRVPTAAELQGDFSADTPLIYDPHSYNPSTGTTKSYLSETGKDAIPGGAASFDPFAAQFLSAYYPAANIPLNTALDVNYQTPITDTTTENEYLSRVDWTISPNDQIYGAFGFSENPTTEPTFVPNLFGQVYEGKSTNVLGEETHVFSSTLVNSARFGYNRSNYFETVQGAGAENYVAKFGLKNLNPLPNQWAPPYADFSTGMSSLGLPNAPQGAIQNRYEIADQINLVLGHHSIFFGGELFKTYFDGNWVISNNGTYEFNGTFTSAYANGVRSKTAVGIPFADFLLGYPDEVTGATGISAGNFRETEVAGFIQDNWKPASWITLNLGLRYQFDNPPYDANGHGSIYNLPTNQNIPGTWDTNYGDVALRIGFALSPDTKTVFRGGFGIYYAGQSPYNFLQFLLAHAPNFYTQAPTFQITNPTLTEDVFVANPTAAGQRPQTLAKHMPDPSVQEFNFFVERDLQRDLEFTVGYVGEVGRHESVRVNANQPNSFAPGTTSTKWNQGPYTFIGDVFGQYNIASSNSNALQSTLKGHFHDGSQVLVSYAWSKAMNTSDGDRLVLADYYKPNLNYAPSAFDRTQLLTVSGLYRLPFGPGEPLGDKAGYLARLGLAGWQLSAIYQLGTGLPVDITATNDADTGSLQTVFAQKVCDPNSGFQRSRSEWFNISCFEQTGPMQYGVGGRNGVREPGIDNLNLGLDKTFQLTERQHLQFRAEMFNIANHPQFSLPGSTAVSSPTIGVLTGTSRPMRSMQLALRYSF